MTSANLQDYEHILCERIVMDIVYFLLFYNSDWRHKSAVKWLVNKWRLFITPEIHGSTQRVEPTQGGEGWTNIGDNIFIIAFLKF